MKNLTFLVIAFSVLNFLSGAAYGQITPTPLVNFPKELLIPLKNYHLRLSNYVSLVDQELGIREMTPDDDRRDSICYEIGAFKALSYELSLFAKEHSLVIEIEPEISPDGFCRNKYSYDPSKIMRRNNAKALKKWSDSTRMLLDAFLQQIEK